MTSTWEIVSTTASWWREISPIHILFFSSSLFSVYTDGAWSKFSALAPFSSHDIRLSGKKNIRAPQKVQQKRRVMLRVKPCWGTRRRTGELCSRVERTDPRGFSSSLKIKNLNLSLSERWKKKKTGRLPWKPLPSSLFLALETHSFIHVRGSFQIVRKLFSPSMQT